jgi:hypothetical protein
MEIITRECLEHWFKIEEKENDSQPRGNISLFLCRFCSLKRIFTGSGQNKEPRNFIFYCASSGVCHSRHTRHLHRAKKAKEISLDNLSVLMKNKFYLQEKLRRRKERNVDEFHFEVNEKTLLKLNEKVLLSFDTHSDSLCHW